MGSYRLPGTLDGLMSRSVGIRSKKKSTSILIKLQRISFKLSTDSTQSLCRRAPRRLQGMSNKPRFGLEAFKFATYVSVPIFMTVVFAANPDNLETIIKQHAYVVYPPEGPKPPTAKEMKRIVEANRKKKVDKVDGPSGSWFKTAK